MASTSTGADTDASTGFEGTSGSSSGSSTDTTTGAVTGGPMTGGSDTETDTGATTENDTETFPPAEPHYGAPAFGCSVDPGEAEGRLTSLLFLLLLARRRRGGAQTS